MKQVNRAKNLPLLCSMWGFNLQIGSLGGSNNGKLEMVWKLPQLINPQQVLEW